MFTLDRITPDDIRQELLSTWRALSYPRYAYCVDGRQLSTEEEEEEEQYPYHEPLPLVGIVTYNSVPVLPIPVPSSPYVILLYLTHL